MGRLRIQKITDSEGGELHLSKKGRGSYGSESIINPQQTGITPERKKARGLESLNPEPEKEGINDHCWGPQ